MDPIAFLGLFFAFTAVAFVIFLLWLGATAIRLTSRAVGGVARLVAGPPDPALSDPNATRCPRRDCLAANPIEARFCRRCGHAMPAASRANERPRLMSAA